MKSSYEKLVLFRAVTAAVNFFLVGQLNIPFDLIAMLIGIPCRAPVIRAVIFALEVLNLMLAALGLFFGNYLGGLFGIFISAVCIYVMCRPDVKERFARRS